MTTVESFQVVAAIGAAAGVAGMLVPGLRGSGAVARQAGAFAVLAASWLLLVGSLVARDDLTALRNRLDSAPRLGAAALAVGLLVALTLIAVRVCLRRPVAWLVLAAVAMPFRVPVSLGSDRSANLLVPLYWVIAVGVIALVWGTWRNRIDGRRFPATVLDVPIAAFTAFSLVSISWSGDIEEATVKAVFFYIPFVILYRLVLAWWPLADRPLQAVVRTTVVLAAAMATIAVGQFATRTIWWNDTLEQGNVYNRFFRANGAFYDPNILGRYLMVALLALGAYALVTRSSRSTTTFVVAAAVISAGLVVTFSRSSALGLMVGIVLLSLRGFGARRTLLVGGTALAVLGGGAIATNENVRDKATSLERLASTGEGRIRLAEGGVDLWRTAPIHGVGLGAFSKEYFETLPRRQQLQTRVVISHTAPVTVLAELGVIGFGLFAILSVAILIALWKAARRDPDGGWAQWTALVMLAAIFVHSLLYSGLFEDPFAWAIAAVGMAVGAARPEPHEATQAMPAVAAAPAG